MKYEDWLKRLKKNNPNITWELISKDVMNELKEIFKKEEIFKEEEKPFKKESEALLSIEK